MILADKIAKGGEIENLQNIEHRTTDTTNPTDTDNLAHTDNLIIHIIVRQAFSFIIIL